MRHETPGVASSFKSETGEDRILAREFAGKTAGYFVEVGAYNGEGGSNTFHFEKALGWTGVLVEADPVLAEEAKAARPGSVTVNCAAVAPDSSPTVKFHVVEGCRFISSLALEAESLKRIEDMPVRVREIEVPAKTLDQMLEECGSREVDFMSIDVEGHEWDVLSGFTPSRWKPKVILLERNHHLPDARIMRYMHRHGYRYRRTTGVNDWFYLNAERAGASYRTWLFLRFYLPKYLTIWMPIVDGPIRRSVKRALKRVGMFEAVRSMIRSKTTGAVRGA
jgi:FkbM family methyltransferase